MATEMTSSSSSSSSSSIVRVFGKATRALEPASTRILYLNHRPVDTHGTATREDARTRAYLNPKSQTLNPHT